MADLILSNKQLFQKYRVNSFLLRIANYRISKEVQERKARI
jgi:hypothetical protein